MNQEFPKHLAAPPSPKKGWSLCFPTLALLYHELLLRAFDNTIPFFRITLLYTVIFTLAAGALVTLLLHLPRGPRLRGGLCYTLCSLWTVLLCVEYCCKSYFKTYFGLGYMANMAGQVMTDFAATAVEVVLARLPFIGLSLLPLLCLILFRRHLLPREQLGKGAGITLLVILVLAQTLGSMLCLTGKERDSYTYNYTPDYAVGICGLNATVRLEVQYAIFGIPEAPLDDIVDGVDINAVDHPSLEQYDYNKMEVDFASLTGSSAIQSLNRYFGAKAASQQNEYTGLFKGKNLILITAEAFSPYVISEELTPTLYRMTQKEGFVFNNFYQPGWGQSTTGGEFAVMTGLIPTWVNNNLSFYVSHRNYMPFALGNQFRALGYNTLAYHNNSYTYYNRHLTHPNLGYDFYGVGNGLQMTGGSNWPYSDEEMFRLTVENYIADYVDNGTPFHTYYMTVSGHANWGWGNAMSAKHREEAVAAYPDASQPVQGYIAANLEIEYALRYLLEQLETAGIADDTVICMTADHYPYALVTEETDYYCELSGINDTENNISRYRNTLLLWCGDMEVPVVVDTPCSTIDIIPTLSNLFGLEYDSRFLSGRDIFAANYSPTYPTTSMPLVILPTPVGNSWITPAGTYEAVSHTFTPNPGVAVGGDYVEEVNAVIDAKYAYARAIIQYDYLRLALNGPEAPPPVEEEVPVEEPVEENTEPTQQQNHWF
ncbi:MAG: LTA synthase family protein [Oscillospiraceae bacterium]|nr:LTA synthase family protein [Oscillospiraceae bacterium]